MKDNLVIIIDDDPVNNKVCSIYIKKTGISENRICFLNGSEGLNYLTNEFQPDNYNTVLIFLDLNMPVMNGWEFLEEYDKLPETYKQKINLYILSSSIDERDIIRARDNINVIDFISKPFTAEILLRLKDKHIK